MVRNPKTPRESLEFFGPVGALGVMVGLPVTEYGLFALCNPQSGCSLLNWDSTSLASFTFYSWEAFIVYCSWFLFQTVLYFVLPGEVKKGTLIRDGTQLSYPINGKLYVSYFCLLRSILCWHCICDCILRWSVSRAV